ncbi:hypothetical protein BXZ70DRAFT_680527 [Cristinia sonorae]|uniref:N-acetyltransferase domain-containing protein n=1 Tax=Cristinia sonorae TaxID=1940300 RepID=A0A8K0UUV1_9AGAR|nr:hypothetical protein BXZ70DRAFT_680527 [Cristinia sonorae]
MSLRRGENSSDDEYNPSYDDTIAHRRKRRKVYTQRSPVGEEQLAAVAQISPAALSAALFLPIIAVLESDVHVIDPDSGEISFEQYMEPLLVDYSRAVLKAQSTHSCRDSITGHVTHLMSRMEAKRILDGLTKSQSESQIDASSALLRRKLIVNSSPLRNFILSKSTEKDATTALTPMPTAPKAPPVNPVVLTALYNIRTTPFSSSFLSRLLGSQFSDKQAVIASDWKTRPPWVYLMDDIHDHYVFRQPHAEHVPRADAPIEYSSLRRDHLPQVHELLTRAFWSGIDVTDSLQYSPEQCTIVATYKKMVIGVALLSSPQETYITYLAVKPGFDNAQIATSMLYHLISLNPHKDIILHVSTTNPAMLLYNRFGFKAEEFIVGFYEDYVESQTRGSQNAFRLRLRQ